MRIRLRAWPVLYGYVAVMTLLVAAHYTLAGSRNWTADAIDALACAAMLVGAVVNRPARRAPWLLLAAANLAALGHAGAVSVLKYLLMIAALLIFVRCREGGRDLRDSADALVPAVGLALLAWFLLVTPAAPHPPLTWQLRLTSVVYLAGDMLVVVLLARLLAPGTLRGLSAALLTLGTIGKVASDAAYVAFDLVGDASTRPTGTALDVGWLVCYVTWGAAALHPSMTELTRPAGEREPNADTPSASMVILRVTSLVVPVALFLHSWQDRNGVEGWVSVACGVFYAMLLARLWDTAASNRRSLIRERALRMAGAALASASSIEEVAVAVQHAATTLVGGSERGYEAKVTAVVVVRGDDGHLRAVTPSLTPATPTAVVDELEVNRLRDLAEGLLAGLDRPRFIAAAEFGGVRPSGIRLLPGEVALLCPLKLKDRPAGDPHIGVLAVYSQPRVLHDLSETLEILASQATLAVERVTLTQEVVRQRSEALFRTLVHDTSDVILVIDDDRRIRFATPSAAGFFGDAAVEGKQLTDLVGPDGRQDAERVIDLILTLSRGGDDGGAGDDAGNGADDGDGRRADSPGYLLRVERLDGRFAVLEVRWSDRRRDPTVGGLVLTLRDMTEQHELEQELTYRAFHDSLTGLPNRVMFTREAADALEEARRTGRTAGVLFVDIDDFKVVNDTMGHSLGDELLVAVAGRLAATVRQTDMAARLGGDEFALLIEDAADVAAVEAFADRLVTAFSEPVPLSEADVPTSVTVGVATSQDSADVDELLRHADLALYAAKGSGKRRWRRYHEALSSGMLRRREIQAALDEAVKTSAFTLAYQPIVSLDSGEIAGFESLIRWPHPSWGVMLPGQFIEIAEETGHIVPIGAWVLRQAMSDLVRWRATLPPPRPEPGQAATALPYVSVNVSARQFRDPGFVDSVRLALRASGLPPEALFLELTETLLFTDNERSRDEVAALKEVGVQLAVDDFGTGYSSLSYLLELPIDVLKIDKTFVTGIGSSWRRYALVEGIIRLARTLQLEVIAEGIETQTERELLVGMGCEFGQGYLLSVPVAADQAEAMLRLGHGLVRQLPRQRREPPADHYLTDL